MYFGENNIEISSYYEFKNIIKSCDLLIENFNNTNFTIKYLSESGIYLNESALSDIWERIKEFFGKIKEAILKFIDKIKNFFTKKKDKDAEVKKAMEETKEKLKKEEENKNNSNNTNNTKSSTNTTTNNTTTNNTKSTTTTTTNSTTNVKPNVEEKADPNTISVKAVYVYNPEKIIKFLEMDDPTEMMPKEVNDILHKYGKNDGLEATIKKQLLLEGISSLDKIKNEVKDCIEKIVETVNKSLEPKIPITDKAKINDDKFIINKNDIVQIEEKCKIYAEKFRPYILDAKEFVVDLEKELNDILSAIDNIEPDEDMKEAPELYSKAGTIFSELLKFGTQKINYYINEMEQFQDFIITLNNAI